MPQLRVKIIFTYKSILDMYDFRQLFVHLLHYVRLDGYYLYRFEKKLLYVTSFAAAAFNNK